MMLLKPVVSGALTSNVMQPSTSFQNGPLVTSVSTIGNSVDNPTTVSTTMLPKTVILPVIQSAATGQQTLSTPSGQQIQITLTPQNKNKSIAPALPSSNPVLNSIKPTITFAPVVSQNGPDFSNVKNIQSITTSKAGSSTAITPKFIQLHNKLSTSLVAATQAPVTSSIHFNSQLVMKPDVPEKKNSEPDFAEALEWEGEIGRLPGSDIKV